MGFVYQILYLFLEKSVKKSFEIILHRHNFIFHMQIYKRNPEKPCNFTENTKSEQQLPSFMFVHLTVSNIWITQLYQHPATKLVYGSVN